MAYPTATVPRAADPPGDRADPTADGGAPGDRARRGTRAARPAAQAAAARRERSWRRRAATADVLIVIAWTSAAAAAALYLATGQASFATVPLAVTTTGVLAGLVGTDLILVMLLLAARIPMLDRAVGHDVAMSTHRKLGKPALYLLLGHGALLLVGYGMLEGLDPIAEIGSILAIPDMPLAAVALGLFLVVVVTSLVAVRRRFPYEVWHGIHLLSYGAVLLAIPHQLSVGGVLAEGTWQRVYWIVLYLLTFGCLIGFRIVEPAIASLARGIRVDAVERVGVGVVSVHMRGRHLDRLGAQGGQYFVWRFWSARTWWHAHPVSLSAVPTETSARITVRSLGRGSAAVARLRPGTRVSIEGPYGMFTETARTAPQLAVVAAGIGIAPLRSLLEHADLVPGEATVLLRASRPDEDYLWNEVRALAEARGIRVLASIGPRAKTGRTWLATDDEARGVTLRSVFPQLDHSDLYICGPQEWADAVEAEARSEGVPTHRRRIERFAS